MPQPPYIVASRRAALRLALAAAAALAGGAAQGQSPAPNGPAHLLVGDVSAAKLHVYAGPDWSLQATFDDLALGAHAGTPALADSRVLTPDDRNKQLVVLRLGRGAPAIERRVPMPIPLPTRYAWAASDPGGSVLAVSGLDSDESVRLLTLVDLRTYAAKQFRVDAGSAEAELNLAVGGDPDPVVFLHLAERVDAFRVADLMTAEAKINAILDGAIKPMGSLSLGKGGHSNSFSPVAGKWTGSTLRGFEVATLAPGGVLGGHRTLSWKADERGGGRNARQRLTFDGRHAFGPLNAPVPPARWAEAEIDLHWVDLGSETVRRAPLARGQVGRGGVSARFAVYASVHPDGDHANLVDVDPASPAFRAVVGRVPLPKLAGGPVRGEPTASKEGRFSAVTPDGRFAFVTQGGEGKVHVTDTQAKSVVRAIDTPTPLKGGGYVAAVQPGAVSADFSAR